MRQPRRLEAPVWLIDAVPESNGMLSWRGAVDGSAGLGRFVILLLLEDVRIAP
jgi:hypothetical protein